MRTAIVHYWLLGMRGGEKVVEALCQLLPDADIFTLFYDPARVSPIIRSHHVEASFLNPLRRHYRYLLPLMPVALEHLDLREYDLVISSESGPAKGVITSSNTRHICYCHSPMRYLWDLYPAYLHEWTTSPLKRALIASLANYLRMWDYASASRVDEFVANSRNVQKRIWKCYRRTSQVLYPPVATGSFYNRPPEDYYLAVSELVSYKRLDDAVRCCSRTGRKLKLVGDGPACRSLKRIAGPEIEFCGRVSASELRGLYARCRALIHPGEEDFGIVAVEAMASGKPVIALGRGGVLESVPAASPRGGFFYSYPGDTHLQRAVEQFEREELRISSSALMNFAQKFSEENFASQMENLLATSMSFDYSCVDPVAANV
ncbi:MAG TPA: glycosyltransferase [Bryobacteraceae bacterium]|nr:glycosyltransferase [Bryobacteraceae bacterium]